MGNLKEETRVRRRLHIGDISVDTADGDVRNSRVPTSKIGVCSFFYFFVPFS